MSNYVDNPLVPNANDTLAPKQFWYTLTAKEEVNGNQSNTGGLVSIYGTSKRVNWKNEVHYIIRVYMKENNVTTRLNLDKWIVTGQTPESVAANTGATMGDFIQEMNDGSSGTIFNTKEVVRVGFQALQPNVMLMPIFKVFIKSGAFPGGNIDLEVAPDATSAVGPVIYFTEGSADPAIPPNIKSEAATGGLTDLISLDKCVNPYQWVALVITSGNKKSVYLKRYKLDGTLLNQKLIGIVPDPAKPKFNALDAGKQEIFRIKTSNCEP